MNDDPPQTVDLAIDQLPGPLAADVSDAWARFRTDHEKQATAISGREKIARSLPRVWAASEFVSTTLSRHPEDIDFLLGQDGLEQPWKSGSLPAPLTAAMSDVNSETAAMRVLRIFRRHEMLKAAWRDLAGWATLAETLGHVSEVADVAIREAVRFSGDDLAAIHGQPVNGEGEPLQLLVLAMGKLGGRELNFSSDVDLVFLFECGGETRGRRPLSHEQYFIRQGQRVIRMLDEVTENGLVFRVDMRLRPFGDSGPLAISLAALEDYLQQHGRAWERYAYVKARPVTGYRPGIGLYRDLLRPFVYRKYLDYGVFESLREMKHLIEVETAEDSLRDDIKRGRGGIREVEFIVQSLQILRGGSSRELRATSLLEVLPRLSGNRLLDEATVRDLEASYSILRKVENRLQQWQDRQVHRLPGSASDRDRLAFSLGFGDWEQCSQALRAHRERVHWHFGAQLDGGREVEEPTVERAEIIWLGETDPERAVEALDELGYRDPRRAAEILQALRGAGFVARLEQKGRQRLDALVPKVLRECGGHRHPETVLERVVGILEAVGLRSAYFALLNESPTALERLAEICGHSEFLARQISRHPLLLDELIDPRVLDRIPDRASLTADLKARLAETGGNDEEAQLDTLRKFQRSAVFLVAVADLSGVLPLMKVSDRLTDIAEVVLQASIDAAWQKMVSRHGTPRCGAGKDRRPAGFAVVGYGKLGGLELGYGSDLDLVFVHDSEGAEQMTDGSNALENGLFFGRLTRRLVHLLSTQTSSGRLYEVDMRLRPSGKGGLLVTSLEAFERYQREQAWTWEHQALLRARAVAGSSEVMAGFEALRRQILCSAVKQQTLREDVAEMRERMRAELGARESGVFDIKQDRGGVADIEFLVQFWVLKNAAGHPSLVRYPDNVRQLESLVEAGILEEPVAAGLREAYLAYRARMHRLALEERPSRVPADEFVDYRRRVAAVWSETFG
jgi:glutamate-ammonia-ligase adenylyltransferase